MSKAVNADVVIRPLVPPEWRDAFPILVQLRSIEESEYLRLVHLQSLSGYVIVGAFLDARIVGFLGLRPVTTLSRGSHLNIDDLVVDERARNYGIGAKLLEFAKSEAAKRNLKAIYLNARPKAISFYVREGFVIHPSPAMRRTILA